MQVTRKLLRSTAYGVKLVRIGKTYMLLNIFDGVMLSSKDRAIVEREFEVYEAKAKRLRETVGGPIGGL